MAKPNKKSGGNGEVPVGTESVRIIYDPIEPQYNALHRAGMAGLAVQLKAMEKDNAAIRPKMEWGENGRAIEVTFNLVELRALLQERYLGIKVTREIQPKKSRKGRVNNANSQTKTYPRLRYLEVLGASDLEKRQDHIRRMYNQSFFQIPRENQRFFKAPESRDSTWRNATLDEIADELWRALLNNETINIQKSTRPNSVKYDLKGVRLRDVAKQTLLLHFWPLASSFFDPVTIVYDPKEKRLVDERQLAPILVVPDVSHVKHFLNYSLRSISRDFPSPLISTPIEAALAFYIAPRLAHGLEVTDEIFNEFQQSVGGATVFAYRYPMKRNRPDRMKQPEVRGVYEETYAEEVLQAYFDLITQGLKSPPYRALRVSNLIAKQPWYYGFDSLVNEWPLELFVPVKTRRTNLYELKPKAEELVNDLLADFRYFATKEDEMEDAESRIPALIDMLVDSYLKERVFGKGQTTLPRKKLAEIFQKEKRSWSSKEQDLVDAFSEKRAKGVNQEFVDFRGATDPRRFTELFVTRLFDPNLNAPYTEPDERAMLRSFYENNWESARWLTLMAISAAGAPRPSKRSSDPPSGGETDDATEAKERNGIQ